MRLLRTDCDDLVLKTFNDERKVPKYAILSHTWLQEGEEVTFDDLRDMQLARSRAGWKKLDFARKQAFRDKYSFVWLDTCCINKSSSAELAEAINSMYRWYQKAEVCYVYLEDMPDTRDDRQLQDKLESTKNRSSETTPLAVYVESQGSYPALSDPRIVEAVQCADEILPTSLHGSILGGSRESSMELNFIRRPPKLPEIRDSLSQSSREVFKSCRWFTRGWTLQELLAPSDVWFFTCSGAYLGSLFGLTHIVSEVTGVHSGALNKSRPLNSFSIAQRMYWASKRHTTRIEDEAYSLLGIFGLNMPILYGEGEGAFLRLQEELLRKHPDHTIFAWSERDDCFANTYTSGTASAVERPTLSYAGSDLLATSVRAFQNSRNYIPASNERSHSACDVTSGNVQFSIPVARSLYENKPYQPDVRAVLNCRLEGDRSRIVCMNLYSVGTELYRASGERYGPRIELANAYRVSQRCKSEVVHVTRRIDRIENANYELDQGIIVCELKYRVTKSMKKLRVSHRTADFEMTGTPISKVSWNPGGRCFHLLCPDEPCQCTFKGLIEITSPSDKSFHQNIQFRVCSENVPSVWFDNGEQSSRPGWSQYLHSLLPSSMAMRGSVTMVATLEQRRLLYGTAYVLEVGIGGVWLALGHAAVVVFSGLVSTLLFIAISCMPFVLSVMVPIAAISISRGNTDVDDSQILGLKIGLPLAFAILIFAHGKEDPFSYVRRGRLARWMGTVVEWKHDSVFDILGTRQEKWVMNLFRGPVDFSIMARLRMLLCATLVSLNFTLTALCAVYTSILGQRLHFLKRHALEFHISVKDYQRTQQTVCYRASSAFPKFKLIAEQVIAWLVLSTAFGVWFSSPFLKTNYPWYMRKGAFGMGAKVALVAALASAPIVAILAKMASQQAVVLKPRSTHDCQEDIVTGEALIVYKAFANITKQTFENSCESFSQESRLLLSIL